MQPDSDTHTLILAYCMKFKNRRMEFFLANKNDKNSTVLNKTVREEKQTLQLLQSCSLLWHINWDCNQSHMVTLLTLTFITFSFSQALEICGRKNGTAMAFLSSISGPYNSTKSSSLQVTHWPSKWAFPGSQLSIFWFWSKLTLYRNIRFWRNQMWNELFFVIFTLSIFI